MQHLLMKLAASGKVLSLTMMLLTVFTATALAQNKSWTTVGSTGTPDESDQVTYTNNIVYLDGDSAVVRYNVVAVDGLFGAGPAVSFPRMTVTFRDNGDNNHVVVRLRRSQISGSALTTLLTLDSNDYASSSSFQTRTRTACGADAFEYDFDNYAYFIEVTMSRTGLPVTPGVAEIKLDRTAGCITGL
jgi:hypothetical protein